MITRPDEMVERISIHVQGPHDPVGPGEPVRSGSMGDLSPQDKTLIGSDAENIPPFQYRTFHLNDYLYSFNYEYFRN